jgi:signal transduction histidine kinase
MHANSPSDRARPAAYSGPAGHGSSHIEHALLRELYGPRKPLLAGNLCGAALLTAVLWADASRTDLVFWALLIASVTLARYSLVRRFNALQPGPEHVQLWTWAYAAGAFAGGILWGAAIGLFPAASADANDQTYVLIVAGLSAAGLSGYAVCPVVFVAFLVPATLPFGWHLFHDAGQMKPFAAAAFFLWLALMVFVAFWRSRRIAETIGAEDAAAERTARASAARETELRAGEAKARVVAQLSHELRTPLNAIVGFSEAIKHGVFGPIGNPRYSAYADNIHDSGRRLLAVIERALKDRALGSDMPPMEETDVDLGEIAAESVAVFAARARECAVTLVPAVAIPAPLVRGNPLKLKQVLINLLSNAVKFTPPGGRVVVELAAPPGDGAVMRVSDTGVGMEKDEIARALDPATPRHDPHAGNGNGHGAGRSGGRGVGLLIAKWLVELHGGRLDLESAPGAGTTATVHLPRERLLLRVVGERRGE